MQVVAEALQSPDFASKMPKSTLDDSNCYNSTVHGTVLLAPLSAGKTYVRAYLTVGFGSCSMRCDPGIALTGSHTRAQASYATRTEPPDVLKPSSTHPYKSISLLAFQLDGVAQILARDLQTV